MRIILLGAPGSGKGTQAKFIIEQYNIPQISTGNMLRMAVQTGNEFSQQIKDIMDTGKLVKDELVIKLVKNRIKQADCIDGFLLDGFPRTIPQAHAMKHAGINIDLVLEFKIPDEIVIDRIIGRRVHLQSGRVYHVKYNPPKIEGEDDITGEKLIIRRDDQEDTVRKRLIEYHQITKPLINYYKKKSEKGHNQYYTINANCKVSELNARIANILNTQ